ncbi:Modification methylase MjaV [uncultured archaeon]|nr:Modification methylase MjaV [uncultured archaeon]
MEAQKFAIYNSSSEKMHELNGKSIDLAVMDPPFNIGLAYEGQVDETSHLNYLSSMNKVIKETQRVLKPIGLALILLPVKIKKQGRVHEYPEEYDRLCDNAGLILVDSFSFKVYEEDFSCVPLNELENATTPENSHTQEMVGMVFGQMHQKLTKFPTGRKYYYTQKEGHPCPFPSELVKDILDTYFVPGNRVLEQFSGTAGLGKEVLHRGGEYRGYESNPIYFEIAKEKLERAGRTK